MNTLTNQMTPPMMLFVTTFFKKNIMKIVARISATPIPKTNGLNKSEALVVGSVKPNEAPFAKSLNKSSNNICMHLF
jgi:hypothetical protein